MLKSDHFSQATLRDHRTKQMLKGTMTQNRSNQMHHLLEKFQNKCYQSDFPKNFFNKELDEINRLQSIIIFGAGNATKSILPIIMDLFEIEIDVILDNKANQTYSICGVNVLNPIDFQFNSRQYFVICTTQSHEEIKTQLFSKKVDPENIFFPKVDHLKYYTHIKQWYLDDGFIKKNIKRIEKAYNLLQDKESKNLFLHRLGLLSKFPDHRNYQKFINLFSKVPKDISLLDNTSAEAFLYFNNERIKNTDQIFIDIGSFHGDSIQHFIKKNNNIFNRVFAYEPDHKNYNVLKNRYGSDSRI